MRIQRRGEGKVGLRARTLEPGRDPRKCSRPFDVSEFYEAHINWPGCNNAVRSRAPPTRDRRGCRLWS
jgi:hypothetical protein